MTKEIIKKYMSPDEIKEVHDDEIKALSTKLLKKIYSKSLGEYILIYNFDNKSDVQVLHEVLNLPLPNGNKHAILMDYIKVIKDFPSN